MALQKHTDVMVFYFTELWKAQRDVFVGVDLRVVLETSPF